MKHALAFLPLALALQACAPPAATLKPIAEQNQANIEALTRNVQVLLALYEPLLKASGDSLLALHLGKVEKELISVVGRAGSARGGEDAGWEALFADSSLAKRYHYVRSALDRGLPEEELGKIQQSEGWVYTAAARPEFTPAKARALVKALDELARTDGADFQREAEARLLPYDPTLAMHRHTLDSAIELLAGLKQEMSNQANFARLHSQSLLNYTQAEVALGDAAANLDNGQILGLLKGLSEKYIRNPLYRDLALNFLGKAIKLPPAGAN